MTGERDREPPAGAERLVPEDVPGSLVLAEHLARYRLAARLARGRRVLDAACGEGYGTAILRDAGAAAATGVDIDAATAARAAEHHGIDAREGDVLALPFADGSFDLVVSFETIEHVTQPKRALDELRRVLASGGALVVSTPNADEYIEDNPYHLQELTLTQFREELERRFPYVELRYQQTFLTTAILREPGLRGDDPAVALDAEVTKIVALEPARALYCLALCSDAPLPDLGPDLLVASDVHEAHELAALFRAWQARAHEAERIQAEWETRATEAERIQREWQARATEAERQVTEMRATLDSISRSLSWRVTKPLRAAKRRPR